jgi:hypothetical protein
VEGCCGVRLLCDACRERRFLELQGSATQLGVDWAYELMTLLSGPVRFERFAPIARARVATLACDVRLVDRLAVCFLAAAKREWSRQTSPRFFPAVLSILACELMVLPGWLLDYIA